MIRSDIITRIFGSPYELCEAAAQQIVNEAAKAIVARDRFTLVLSGGTTPRAVYKLLATYHRDEVDWEKTFLIFGDERLVPPEHVESNYRMLKEMLLDKISIPEQNVLRMKTELANAADEYEVRLREALRLSKDEFPRFDLALLGLGEDGHTASLFPNSAALKERFRIAVHVTVPDNAIPERITLTVPVFNAGRMVIFLVTGNAKAIIVLQIYDGPKCTLPPTHIRPTNGELFWYLDLESSSKISAEY